VKKIEYLVRISTDESGEHCHPECPQIWPGESGGAVCRLSGLALYEDPDNPSLCWCDLGCIEILERTTER